MSDGGERLFNLLPAAVRARDAAQGWPLRALVGVLEGEYRLLERDVEQLYDDWFIETCADWVVPYIGDLLGVRGLLPVAEGAFSQRALVADTLAFRRAKGTAAVLERLARAMAGWPAVAVEFFNRLAVTQHTNHVRPGPTGTLEVRALDALDRLGGPFSPAAHTADVRHIDNGRGRYNLPNVGLFLWRLQGYPVRGDARAVAAAPDGRHTFSPLGLDAPLFHTPGGAGDGRPGETDVPDRIRPLAFLADLTDYEGRYAATPAFQRPPDTAFYYGPDRSLQVVKDGEVVPPLDIVCMNLGAWDRPPAGKVGVDVRRGRLAFATGESPQRDVVVSYGYGLAGDVGGGPYDRQASVARWRAEDFPDGVTWQIGVTRDPAVLATSTTAAPLVNSLATAIDRWNTHAAATPDAAGVIALMDSRTHGLGAPLPEAVIPERCRLAIVAADWPEVDNPDAPGGKRRALGQLLPDGRRPHVAADVSVRGGGIGEASAGRLVLDGLLIEGRLTVSAGRLGSLHLAHCTLAPGHGGLAVSPPNTDLGVTVARSITGPITLTGGEWRVRVEDSIVDPAGGAAVDAPESAADLQTSTFLGTVTVRTLEAGNSIFTGKVTAVRRQAGCARFCYLPFYSLSPRRYRCQPADAAAARVAPQFTATVYGRPGYGQLAADTVPEIGAGAEDEDQMGAFHFLQQARRLRNLRAGLDEYLRFGLEAGTLFVT
jgi:hypothetical protein